MGYKKVLITGGSGLLGYNLIKTFSHHKTKYKVFGIYFKNCIFPENCIGLKLDLRNSSDVKKTMEKIKPDIIIHCAALTDVDLCEKEKDECYQTNVISTKNLCDYKPKKFIYISTDAVYPGITGNYSEDSETRPVNYYGQTKLEAEKIVSQLEDNSILRVNIFGINPTNKLSLAEWFIKKFKNGEPIKGFTDVYFNPILVNHLSDIIIETIERNITGLYNIGSPDIISKYEFGIKVAEVFKFNTNLISKSLSKEINA